MYKAIIELPCYLRDGRFVTLQGELMLPDVDFSSMDSLLGASIQMMGIPRVIRIERVQDEPDFQD